MPGSTAQRPDLAALRAAVYRPGATAEDVTALEQALAELREAEPPVLTESAAPPPAGPEEQPEQGGPQAAGPPVRRFQSRRWAALAGVAAAVVGCAGGATLVSLARPAETAASALVVPTSVHISTTAGDAVFRRAQRPSDRAAAELDPALVPGSVRRLLDAGRIQLYAAQDRSGRRCLVGVQTRTVVSCVTPERFRRSGLRILWTSDVVSLDTAGLREMRYRLALAADWRPDGRVVLGALRG